MDFRGRIVGPTYETDRDELDFGIVAYGYRYAKEFTLRNTCEIPLRYAFASRTTRRRRRSSRAFPRRAPCFPLGSRRSPSNSCRGRSRRYAAPLVMDVPGVGDALARIPIRAECCVPNLSLSSRTLNFGECFIRHGYAEKATLTNESRFPAKFSVPEQDEQSAGLAAWTVTPSSGSIAASESVELTFTLRTEYLGIIHLPRRRGCGRLRSSSRCRWCRGEICRAAVAIRGDARREGREDGWAPRIQFGVVGVLKDQMRTIWVTNDSLIPAEIKAFIQDANSAFEVDAREKILQPGKSSR